MITQDLKSTIEAHGLQYPKHWKTIEALKSIWHNGLQGALITDTPFEYFTEPFIEPVQIEDIEDSREFVKQLNQLFDDGWEILLETRSYHGDEGGPLLMVYLVNKETYDRYWREFDKLQDSPGIGFEMEFINNNRSDIKATWSGAY